jgi:hypothetical protein
LRESLKRKKRVAFPTIQRAAISSSDSFWNFEEVTNHRRERIHGQILIQRRSGSQKLGGLKGFPMHEAGNRHYLEIVHFHSEHASGLPLSDELPGMTHCVTG